MFVLDLSIYFPIPLLNTEGFISLIRALLSVAPKNPPPHVAAAIAALKKAVDDGMGLLVVRIDEDLSTGLERAFDILVDYVWGELRTRLQFAAIYSHDGAAKFTDEDREQLDFDERLAEGRIAKTMLERLYPDGLDFLRTRYSEQATNMSTRLDWIASKDFEPALESIAGPHLVKLLKVCQERYEDMVADRGSRKGKSAADLRELRNTLRRQIAAYCGAVGTMYVVGDGESAKLVEDALRPILITRARARRKALGLLDENQPLEDEGLGEKLDADLDAIEDSKADEIDDQVEDE